MENYLHPSNVISDEAVSETSFESGNEVEGIVGQAEVTEESLGLKTNRKFYLQLSTPPPSPITSTPALLSSDQREMPRSIADLSMPLSIPSCQRCSSQPRSNVATPAQEVVQLPNTS